MLGRLKVQITEKIQESYEVRDGLTIGRSNKNDLVLLDPSVSRVHAILSVRDGRPVIRDNGSANGILVNGVKVPEHPLAEGDRVSIGAKSLVFTVAAPVPETPGTVVDLTKKPLASYPMKEIVRRDDVLLVIPTIEPLMEMIYEIVAQMILESPLQGEAQAGFISAVQEGVRNGATHGNKWSPGRRLRLRYVRTLDQVTALVADEGGGFDYKAVLEKSRKIGSKTVQREKFLKEAKEGRGVVKMLAAVDAVEYNEKGNEVILTKYVHSRGGGKTKWVRGDMETVYIPPKS